MEIRLSRAMTPQDSGYKPCDWCEADFEPRPIIVSVGPYGFEICDDCARAILRRENRSGVAAEWPTWEEYQEALRNYPEPMMSRAECERAERLGLYDELFDLAQLT